MGKTGQFSGKQKVQVFVWPIPSEGRYEYETESEHFDLTRWAQSRPHLSQAKRKANPPPARRVRARGRGKAEAQGRGWEATSEKIMSVFLLWWGCSIENNRGATHLRASLVLVYTFSPLKVKSVRAGSENGQPSFTKRAGGSESARTSDVSILRLPTGELTDSG